MSLTALFGLALGTAAMTIVLSAFAGLEELISEQFEDANADLKLSPVHGPHLKLNATDSLFLARLKSDFPETKVLPVYKKRVLLTYGDNQHIAYLLGVPEAYNDAHKIQDHLITQADPGLDLGSHTLSLGSGVAYHLGISSTNPPPIISVYLPKVTTKTTALNLSNAIDAVTVFANGVHSIQPDYDQQYVIAPEKWVREFTGATVPSYFEFHSSEEKKLRKTLENYFGDRVVIANTLEQEATLFKVMRSERLVVLAILSFVVVLASFGVVSALTIIALEKKSDIRTLWSMGTSEKQLRGVFFKNGMLIVASGWLAGLTLGTFVILLQKYVGIVPLGSGYIREYYPVQLTIEHLALTSAIVLSIGTVLSAWATRNVAVIKQ
tara:strand:- start:2000 stop:3139 length:1140 start_codon:yes stop_codon:yes gene_type:complete